MDRVKVAVRRDGEADVPASPRAKGICDCDLQAQNRAYSGTGGVSRNNRDAGFVPAYFNHATGESCVSVYADGSAAPVHVLEGLPEAWVAARDEQGAVIRTHDAVEAGFMRNGRFYNRDAAARLISKES